MDVSLYYCTANNMTSKCALFVNYLYIAIEFKFFDETIL